MTDPADPTEILAAPGARAPAPAAPVVALARRYELTRRVASGGMATVWLGYDALLARPVAIKLLHDHLAADGAFRERFRREAIAAAKLSHPNVVNLYDTGTDGDHVYLVMEFVEGATLRDVIADRGTLEVGEAAAIAEKVARALDFAHERGLVHRDVKPANILIGDDGAVKVADFGIAKAEEADADLTGTGMVLGTAAYVAPEQITGSRDVDGRADQYALGCMLYEALAGRQPFKGDSAVATAAKRLETDAPPLRSVRPDVPRGLEAVVVRALARRPDHRYPTAGSLADALLPFVDANTAQTAALAAGGRGPGGGADSAAASRAAGGSAAPPRHRSGRAEPKGSRRAPAGAPGPGAQGRWLGAMLVLLLLGGAALGLALATGALESPDLTDIVEAVPERIEPSEAAAPRGAVAPLEVTAAAAFDPPDPPGGKPGGDGEENDDDLPALLDGDPTTTWRTDRYHSAAFGGLKDGVGFALDLGAQHEITGVTVTTTTPGVSYEIRVADERGEQLDDWTPVAAVDDAAADTEVAFDEPVLARHVLLWVTAPLPTTVPAYRAEFSDVTVLGRPA